MQRKTTETSASHHSSPHEAEQLQGTPKAGSCPPSDATGGSGPIAVGGSTRFQSCPPKICSPLEDKGSKGVGVGCREGSSELASTSDAQRGAGENRAEHDSRGGVETSAASQDSCEMKVKIKEKQ